MKEPLYITPNLGVEVVGEYTFGPYMRCYIRPHPAFGDKTIIRRSRLVMADHLGRALLPDEHVHHRNHQRRDDRIENLELTSPAEHNRHHKLGQEHSATAREKISAGLRKAKREGRRSRPDPEVSRRNIAEWNRKVATGEVKPWSKGDRNKALVAFFRETRCAKKTAERFGITTSAVYWVLKKHGSDLPYQRQRGKRNP